MRIPAAWNGITGLKTTIGRISVHGVLPLSPTLDTLGPITRGVEDAATLLCLLQGPDPLDPRTIGYRDCDPWPTLWRGVKGLRFGRLPVAERRGIDAEVLTAYDRSVDLLASLGADIVDLRMPMRFADLGAVNGWIMSAEAYAMLADLVDNPASPLDEAVRPRVQAGATISSRDYLTAPAVPNGFTAGGLPLSLQIVCRGYNEAMALRIGWAYQTSTDWQDRVPPMAAS